jgi:hypothetical protein
MKSHPILVMMTVSFLLGRISVADAHDSCCTVNSPGVPAVATITLDGVEQAGEWTAATSKAVGDGNPLHGTLKMLHKEDGIYILAVIDDSTVSDIDAFNLRFDIDNNGGPMPDGDDFGVQILRNGQALWGPALANPNTWSPVPANLVGVTKGTTSWTVEFHLPTGAPSNLSLSTGAIGAYFSFYDSDNAFGQNSAKYAQWPWPPDPPITDPNALLDGNPGQWANYVFNPETTFPDVAVTGVRREGAGGAANYNKIDYAGINSFEVQLNNPGGTAIADAKKVRVNLYMAARGIGESWHRLDTNAILTADCSAPDAAWQSSSILPKTDVCNGMLPLPDISSKSIPDVVGNTAKYTIQDGIVMKRTGGDNITVAGGAMNYLSIIDWNTTPAQDHFFVPTDALGNVCTIGTMGCYDRAHTCMLGEAIVPNDPNTGNNTLQVNMDFIGVPFGNLVKVPFSLGWYGFAKYNPDIGGKMLLQVSRRNMDESFRFEVGGLKQIGAGVYEADLKGRLSLPVTAAITATNPDPMGKTLKENIIVPPQAGGVLCGSRYDRCRGLRPIYVDVPPDSTLWIVNYSVNDKDIQYVDVDGKGPLPPNGPAGLPPALVGPPRGNLLVDNARLGELVLSFDEFRHGVGIAEGVEVRVPPGARSLALAINDYDGSYGDNAGTGFRVKIIQRPAARAAAPPSLSAAFPGGEIGGLTVRPILDLLPQVCVSGYEDSGNKRTIANYSSELYRFIGNVCWTVMNVLPKPERPPPAATDRPRR